jgi:hypothetical protein
MQPKELLLLLSEDNSIKDISLKMDCTVRNVNSQIKKLRDRLSYKTTYGMVADFERRKLNVDAQKK